MPYVENNLYGNSIVSLLVLGYDWRLVSMDEIRKRLEVSWLVLFHPRAVVSKTGTVLVILFILFTLSLMLLISSLPDNTVSSIDPADYNWNRDNRASKQHINKSLTLCPSISPLTGRFTGSLNNSRYVDHYCHILSRLAGSIE